MKVRERSFGKVSVVQIARAAVSQAVWVEARVECAVGMWVRIFLMGRLLWVGVSLCVGFGFGAGGVRLSYYSCAHDYGAATFAVISRFKALVDL